MGETGSARPGIGRADVDDVAGRLAGDVSATEFSRTEECSVQHDVGHGRVDLISGKTMKCIRQDSLRHCSVYYDDPSAAKEPNSEITAAK